MVLKTKEVKQVEFENIPSELTDINMWVIWKSELQIDKNNNEYYTKVPYQTNGIHKASVADKNTWSTFEAVKEAYENGIGQGVGLIINENHNVYVLDIDDTTESEHYEHFKHATYCEYSPSGNGIHVYMIGEKPKDHYKKVGDLELFSTSGFVTVTGHHNNDIDYVADLDSHIDHLIKQVFEKVEYERSADLGESPEMSDEEIITLCEKAGNKDKFKALYYDGDISFYNDDESSADAGLAGILAFYTQGVSQIERIMRESALYRDKWDRRESYPYIMRTIDFSLSQLTSVYKPNYNNSGDYSISFLDEKPDTLASLLSKLTNAGFEEREARADIDKNTGEKKVKPLQPRIVADVIKQYCTIIMIDYGDADNNPLAIYNPDEGIYTRSRRFMFNLFLKVQSSLNEHQCKTVLHFLEIEGETVPLTDSENLKPLNNGIYDKENETLLPFSKDYIFVSKVSTDYVENAPEPTYDDWSFSRWINDEISEGDPTKIHLIWQVLANAVDVNTTAKLLVFLYSDHSNSAKSTFGDLTIELVGRSNFTSLRIKDFDNERNIADVFGKALIYGDDNYPKDNIDDNANLKSVAGGDVVRGRKMYESPFSFKATPLVIQSMNGMPDFKSIDDGFLERLRVIKFNHAYAGENKNPRVKTEYIKDKRLHEYILFESLKYDSKNIVDTDESMREKNHLQRTDPMYAFFEDIFSQLRSERIPVKLLHNIYKSWHFNEMGEETNIKQNTFTKEAKVHAKIFGYDYQRKNYRASTGNDLDHDKEIYDGIMPTEGPHFNTLLNPKKQQAVFFRK